MVIPIIIKKRKEKHQKSFLGRVWPFILGSAFILMVITVIIVAVTTVIKLFVYFN